MVKSNAEWFANARAIVISAELGFCRMALVSRVMTKHRPNPTGKAEFFFWPLWTQTTER